MNYIDLEKYLFEISNQKFADFSKTLSNSDYISIGVKNPTLRAIIKENINNLDLRLEDFKLGKYLEVDFIYFGLAISRLKDIDLQLAFLKEKIHLAKSWAITDCVATFIKKCPFDKYYSFFLSLCDSSHTYDRRMAFVLGLKQYKDHNILKVLKYIKINEEYMVMMAIAWLLVTIAITYPNEIYDYLKNSKDLTLKRKTISKIVESYRIDDNNKGKFKSLRNN